MGDLRLDHRVERRGIVPEVDLVQGRHEQEAGIVLELLLLELPDAIPEDVRGPHRPADHAQRMGPDDTERLADVAHDDLIERRVEVLQQVEDPDAQVVVHAAVGERLRWELALGEAEIVGRDQRGGKNPGKAEEAVTASATGVSRAGRISTLVPPLVRCCMIRPALVNEQRPPSLMFVVRRCSSGVSGS